jgi:hypothetical protein
LDTGNSAPDCPDIECDTYGLQNGDTLKASVVGNLITVCVNDVVKAQIRDDTYKSGDPGIGIFLGLNGRRETAPNSDFGFANYTARGIGSR